MCQHQLGSDAAEEQNLEAAGQEDQSLQDETASSPQRRVLLLESLGHLRIIAFWVMFRS